MSVPLVGAPNGPVDGTAVHAGRLTFIGTATTLLHLGHFTLLTDPNFLHRGQRAYLGMGLWSRRLTDPSMQPDELPTLDAVVLSHLHGKHFDRVTRRHLSRDQPVFTTTAAARKLDAWGFTTDAMRTWDECTLARGDQTLRVVSLPGVHARGLMGALLPPVMGTLLELERPGRPPFRVYLSGDTLTGDHLDEVARRFPQIDVAVMHLGGTRTLMHRVTMDGEQGVDFLRRIRPATAVPVHHDDYRVFRDSLSTFLRCARDADVATLLRPVARGQTVTLG